MDGTPNYAHPTLYALRGEVAVLLGQLCDQCGRVGFPRQSYGCEFCGAINGSLCDIDLPATGVLSSFATVHRHHGNDIQAPFVIGQIRLDSGPVIRCTLAAPDSESLSIGDRMSGVIVHCGTPADGIVELRFSSQGG